MGRIAGVSAEETRDRVLDAAASVFARKGYDAARISEIASGAGVSGGAVYSHFPSKADLFAAALHVHGYREADRRLAGQGADFDPVAAIAQRGLGLGRRDAEKGSLLVQGIVAANRHPEVAEALVAALTEREERMAEMLRAGQSDGAVARSLQPAAVSRFLLMVVLGSMLVAATDLPPVDDDDWTELIDDLVGRFRPRRTTA
jgi:AcrR family transcriptional regulator